jgi:putative transposase
MTASSSGSAWVSLKTSGGAAFFCMTSSTALTGSGKAAMALTCARLWGGKECGPNPTDRAKAGVKDHILSDGRGVPLALVVTPANVNDSPTLPELLQHQVAVRPQPSRKQTQHLCLDAAFDNAPSREVLLRHNYVGHIAPRKGRDENAALHPGGQAHRWVVERLHSWHDRFRRLVNNWEKHLERRYAFICLANALIAYRT